MLNSEDVESPGNTVYILVVIYRLKEKLLLAGSSEVILRGKKRKRKKTAPLESLTEAFIFLKFWANQLHHESVVNILGLYTVFTS